VLQYIEGGLLIGQNKIGLLDFADDLNLIGDSIVDTANAARVLEKAAKKIDLEINTEKTKIMELIESGEDPNESENLSYEKVSDFKYLGTTLSTKNEWLKEISIRINKAQKAFYALTKFFRSKMLFRETKVRRYAVIIGPILMYGFEA